MYIVHLQNLILTPSTVLPVDCNHKSHKNTLKEACEIATFGSESFFFFFQFLLLIKSNMKCKLACKKHSKFKSFGRCFIEFWHEYFQSTGISVRDLPIKYFLSAVDLVKLCDLSKCDCKDLVKNLYPDPSFECNYCQKSFSTKSELKSHVAETENKMKSKLKSHQLKQQQKHFQCVFCAKFLGTKVSFIRHMELHTKEHECRICKKAMHFFDLERHKSTRGHLERVKNQSNHSNCKLELRRKSTSN